MQNKNQFVRQPSAVLLVFGLIVSLLPGFTAAQDLSTKEERGGWVIEQTRGDDIALNGKFAASTALARLALNPDDAEVIDKITHFYDKSYEENLSHNYAPVHLYPYYSGEFYVDYTAFRLLYKSPDRFNFI